MANQIQYTLAFVTADGTLLTQEQDVKVDRTTNSQAVSTVALGYAGESPGAPMVEIDVTNAVPAGGFEFQAGVKMTGLISTQVYVLGPGGQTHKSQGQIYADSFSHGVNKAAAYSFRMRAPMVDWS